MKRRSEVPLSGAGSLNVQTPGSATGLKKRSEVKVALIVPSAVPEGTDRFGPVSPNTGGGLNANEAERVVCGRSSLVVGYSYEYRGRDGKGLAQCAQCMRGSVERMPGEVLYEPDSKWGKTGDGKVYTCFECHRSFYGELSSDSPRR